MQLVGAGHLTAERKLLGGLVVTAPAARATAIEAHIGVTSPINIATDENLPVVPDLPDIVVVPLRPPFDRIVHR